MRFLQTLSLASATATLVTAVYVPGKAFDRFITIWLENQDFTNVDRNSDIDNLTKQGILLTEYYGLTHPSQPNYIASVGGDYFGLNHDGLVNIPQNVSTLVDLFDTKNIDWRGYFEGIPGPGYMAEGSTPPGGKVYDYVRKHNPFVSYDSVNMNGTRLAKIQSLDDFQNDVKANTLPQYAHISPDMNNDGHDTGLAFAANWTLAFLTPLLANEQFMNNTLILLTYDESETYSIPNRIVSLLLGGAVPQELKGTNDTTVYTHYSILSTLENNWDLPNLGRYDVGANVFDLVASKTRYTNHPPGNLALLNNSLSYPGFLNNIPEKYLPLPPPNLQLIGAGGQGVDATVTIAWEKDSKEQTPYDGSGDIFDGGNGESDSNAPIYKAQGPAANVTTTGTAPSASPSTKSWAMRQLDINWAGVGFATFALAAFVL